MSGSIDFRGGQGVYQQIADYCIDRVLRQEWPEGVQIPSVRQLAAEVGVNPNTVQRAYGHLQELGIVETRRGLGVFVHPSGADNARILRRDEFKTYQLPELVRTLRLLDMSLAELVAMITATYPTLKLQHG